MCRGCVCVCVEGGVCGGDCMWRVCVDGECLDPDGECVWNVEVVLGLGMRLVLRLEKVQGQRTNLGEHY